MLPFTHSKRCNERYNPVTSITRRSTQANTATKELPYKPYNATSHNNYTYPEDSPSFRQQFRPLHEQVMESGLSNIIVPLAAPMSQPVSYYGNGSAMNGGGGSSYYQSQMSHHPSSPLLDQVLTEVRLGTDDWYGKPRKGSSKLISIRKFILIAMGLMAFGFLIYQGAIIERGEHGTIKLRMIKGSNSKMDSTPPSPVKPLPTERAHQARPSHTERAYVPATEMPSEKHLPIENIIADENIIHSHFEEAVAGTSAEILRERVLENLVILSINEDYETILEVVG